MGFFDRLLGRVERDNPEIAYQTALAQLDRRITEQKTRLAQLLRRRDEPGYEELASQARQVLEGLEASRRQLELERLTGPAAQQVAEARVQLADEASGLGERASSRALGSVRDDVEALKRRASPGLLDADGIPIHGRQEHLARRSREDAAREELARLKAALDAPED